MGDRANIFVIDPFAEHDPERPLAGTYLYSHWGGSDLPATLADALDSSAGRGRWNDGPYLTRIIFCRMVAGDVDGETGFGISASLNDNEYPILVVDPDAQTVRMMPQGSERNRDGKGTLGSWTFDDFVALRPGWPEDEDD